MISYCLWHYWTRDVILQYISKGIIIEVEQICVFANNPTCIRLFSRLNISRIKVLLIYSPKTWNHQKFFSLVDSTVDVLQLYLLFTCVAYHVVCIVTDTGLWLLFWFCWCYCLYYCLLLFFCDSQFWLPCKFICSIVAFVWCKHAWQIHSFPLNTVYSCATSNCATSNCALLLLSPPQSGGPLTFDSFDSLSYMIVIVNSIV